MACGGGSGWQQRWRAAVAPGDDCARWKLRPVNTARHGSSGHRRWRRPVVAPRDGGDLPRHDGSAYVSSGRPNSFPEKKASLGERNHDERRKVIGN
jgi:hypothetical protein